MSRAARKLYHSVRKSIIIGAYLGELGEAAADGLARSGREALEQVAEMRRLNTTSPGEEALHEAVAQSYAGATEAAGHVAKFGAGVVGGATSTVVGEAVAGSPRSGDAPNGPSLGDGFRLLQHGPTQMDLNGLRGGSIARSMTTRVTINGVHH